MKTQRPSAWQVWTGAAIGVLRIFRALTVAAENGRGIRVTTQIGASSGGGNYSHDGRD
ncbi:MAG TPA: hypothetical protein VMM78_12825 [Thermomicrobiales bacterium]|nr:hypothetical protein [Thermomicrobiales bacterium]